MGLFFFESLLGYDMEQDDTIAAISTALGEGGIGVVRMSGPHAADIVEKVFRGEESVAQSESHRAFHGWIVDGEEPIDEVIVTVFRAPNSYTGEDVVEVSCHGGTFVSRRILEVLSAKGARPARPGEFTRRAFVRGKIDLSQAEAVADLVRAQTEASRKVAVYQLEGGLSKRTEEVRKHLIEACSLLEVEIDFPEEDVEFVSRDTLGRTLRSQSKEMKALLQSFDRGRVCREGVRMVIVGRPNVGKSSILNSLVERERAIVTEVPGTTRDTIEDVLDIEGLLFVITDTAGIRESDDPVEREGVRRAEQALERADLVLLVFDGSEPLTHEDEVLVRRIPKDRKRVFVVNKTDLDQRIDIPALQRWAPAAPFLRVSALKQTGISELIQTLKQAVLSGGIPHEGEILLTNVRHRDCLIRAERRISQAEASLRRGMSQEFVALDLRCAVEALGEITGQTASEDILDHIFSNFCIGK